MNDDFDVVEAEKEYKRLKETSDKANITFVICLFSVTKTSHTDVVC